MLAADHCKAGDIVLLHESMHHLIRSPCYSFSLTASAEAVVCLSPCSMQLRQQITLQSRQELLSTVHGNAGDTTLWYALHAMLSWSPCLC